MARARAESRVGDSGNIMGFWFDEAEAEKWYAKDPQFDQDLTNLFGAAYAAAAVGELEDWAESAAGTVALCILLDQFPRNMFRGTPQAFASDGQALAITEGALARGLDGQMPSAHKQFLYMPLMHSEQLADQERCVTLFRALADADPDYEKAHDFAVAHRDIVVRFGRFPHRNEVLGRESSDEEIAFLKQPDSSF